MMARLIRTEMHRLWLRRLTRVTVVLVALLAVGLAVAATWSQTRPITASERVSAEQQMKEQSTSMPKSDKDDCVKQRADMQKQGTDVSGWACGETSVDMYLRHVPSFWEVEENIPRMVTSFGVLAGLVIGASFIGAEFSSGSIANHLTFEPRRTPVVWSKLLAAAFSGAIIGAALDALLVGATWLVCRLHKVPTGRLGNGSAHWGWEMSRTVGATVAVMLAAASLALLLRHTAAVIGLAVGWMIVFQIATNMFDWLGRWDLTRNLQAFVEGQSHYSQVVCHGNDCESVMRTISLTQGSWLVWSLTTVVILAAWAVFQRRDIN